MKWTALVLGMLIVSSLGCASMQDKNNTTYKFGDADRMLLAADNTTPDEIQQYLGIFISPSNFNVTQHRRSYGESMEDAAIKDDLADRVKEGALAEAVSWKQAGFPVEQVAAWKNAIENSAWKNQYESACAEISNDVYLDHKRNIENLLRPIKELSTTMTPDEFMSLKANFNLPDFAVWKTAGFSNTDIALFNAKWFWGNSEENVSKVRFSDQAEGHLGACRGVSRTQAEGRLGACRGVMAKP